MKAASSWSSPVPFLMPDRTHHPWFPDHQALLEQFAYSPRRRKAEGVAVVDAPTWARARSAVPVTQIPLAWGDVEFTDPVNAPRPIPAWAIVTDAGLHLRWRTAEPAPRTLTAWHDSARTFAASTQGQLNVSYNAVDVRGQYLSETLEANLFIAPRYGWDPHANRRAFTVVTTLALLGGEPPGEAPAHPPMTPTATASSGRAGAPARAHPTSGTARSGAGPFDRGAHRFGLPESDETLAHARVALAFPDYAIRRARATAVVTAQHLLVRRSRRSGSAFVASHADVLAAEHRPDGAVEVAYARAERRSRWFAARDSGPLVVSLSPLVRSDQSVSETLAALLERSGGAPPALAG